MPCKFHIVNDDACRRLARSRSPDRASVPGKNASSAPYSVAVRLPLYMSTWPYQSSPCTSSATCAFTAATLVFHIARQSWSPNNSQHFHKYSRYESMPPPTCESGSSHLPVSASIVLPTRPSAERRL